MHSNVSICKIRPISTVQRSKEQIMHIRKGASCIQMQYNVRNTSAIWRSISPLLSSSFLLGTLCNKMLLPLLAFKKKKLWKKRRDSIFYGSSLHFFPPNFLRVYCRYVYECPYTTLFFVWPNLVFDFQIRGNVNL